VSEEVTVVAQSDAVFSAARTGAATAISRETLATLPTLSNRLTDFTRLTPQAAGTSFGGVDNRLNKSRLTAPTSITRSAGRVARRPHRRRADFAVGHRSRAGQHRAYDVRQGNFVGAGVNTVTRSGGNAYRGSAFYQWRTRTWWHRGEGARVQPGTFDFQNMAAGSRARS